MGFLAIALLLHPFHVSIAEAEWNLETRRLEVALRLHPMDLEAAISRSAKQRIDLERDEPPRVQQAVTDYLRQRIYLARGEQRGEFRWVGIEDQTKYVWVYFELVPPAGDEPLRLGQRALVEILPDQANTVLLRKGDQHQSFRFTRQRPEHAFPALD